MVLHSTELLKLVHSYTSLFLLLDGLKICTVKCISNSPIFNLLGKRGLILFSIRYYDDDSDTAVAKVSVSST